MHTRMCTVPILNCELFIRAHLCPDRAGNHLWDLSYFSHVVVAAAQLFLS